MRQVLLKWLEMSALAEWSIRKRTTSRWPSKQAALRGVELNLVLERNRRAIKILKEKMNPRNVLAKWFSTESSYAWLTSAPAATSASTTLRWPAPAAHHSAQAPSMEYPPNLTDPVWPRSSPGKRRTR